MDEAHLMTCVRYVSLNPVRARLAARADWPWSSARPRLAGADDALVTVRLVLDRCPRILDLLRDPRDDGFDGLRRSEGSGRPVGNAEFIQGLERILDRPIARRAPGRKSSLPASQQPPLPL